MSAQFGRWSFSGQPAPAGYIERARQMLAPHGPDGESRYAGPGVDIIYRAFHTTRESRREQQPVQVSWDAVLTWDGRLDNREELIRQLDRSVTLESSDAAIAAAAYERWGTKSFGKLIGDWALSIWNPKEQTLLLAKDFLGTRHLYYLQDEAQVLWSSILEPIVLLAGKTFQLEKEYIAGWLSLFPAAHPTPYAGIHAVPPSTFVSLRAGQQTATRYWDFDPHKQVRYTTDGEYEEHFRAVFQESVRRRMRSDAPVLAELSGGMDSSSIVCMADQILAQGHAETPRLDTISCYDDFEPNWNERPYIAKVEDGRGRAGCHIDVSSFALFASEPQTGHFPELPSSLRSPAGPDARISECLTAQGNLVLLSGIGGDEFTGGVPSSLPELADLLARARFASLARKLKAWALEKRMPWFHLLVDTVADFIPRFLIDPVKKTPQVPWLTQEFARELGAALSHYAAPSKLLGPLPSFQQSMKSLELLRAQLGCCTLSPPPAYEKSYPYLDRDFVEFAIAVPREQMVRPGQRRSLMRRALAGIVPEEILHRKRKAFVIHGPLKAISSEWEQVRLFCAHMRSDSLRIINSSVLLTALTEARSGHMVPLVPLLRTVVLERWLRSLESWNCIDFGGSYSEALSRSSANERIASVPSWSAPRTLS